MCGEVVASTSPSPLSSLVVSGYYLPGVMKNLGNNKAFTSAKLLYNTDFTSNLNKFVSFGRRMRLPFKYLSFLLFQVK